MSCELRLATHDAEPRRTIAITHVDEYQEILYSNLEEYDRLTHMIADMLFLAKSDNGLIVPNRESIKISNRKSML